MSIIKSGGRWEKHEYGYIYSGFHKNYWRGITWAFTTLASVAGVVCGLAAYVVVEAIGERLRWDGPYAIRKANLVRVYRVASPGGGVA